MLKEEGKGAPAGFAAPRARDAEAPPASHSVQEVPADERSAATPLRVRVVGGEGGGWFWNGIKGVGEGTVFKGCLKKVLFITLRNEKRRMLLKTAENKSEFEQPSTRFKLYYTPLQI